MKWIRKKIMRFLFTRKWLIEFCFWSKQAEWKDGQTKRAFINNDWDTYIRLFINHKNQQE